MKHLLKLLPALAIVACVGIGQPIRADGEPAAGKLKVANNRLALKLDINRNQAVTIPAGREIGAPAGVLRPQSFTLYAQDGQRRTWELNATRALGELREIQVVAGETTELNVGTPITVGVNVNQTRARDGSRTVSLSLFYRGAGGELYGPDAKMNNTRVPAPPFEILDENGRRLHQDSFSYG